MGKMPRKDYNGTLDVAPNNEVLKRVNTQNAPNSLQATGHTLTQARQIPMTSANLDAIVGNDRFLDISREKFAKNVVKNVGVLTSLDLVFKDEKGVQVTESYTKAQLLASKSLFIAAKQ